MQEPISRIEVNEIDNLLNALNDIENGKTPQKNSQKNQNKSTYNESFIPDDPADTAKITEQMSGLLNSLEIMDGSPIKASTLYGNGMPIEESYNPYDEQSKLNEIYGKLDNSPVVSNNIDNVVEKNISGKSWRLLEESALGMKSTKSYSIQNTYNNQIILDNIMMYESAIALLNVLNNGKSLTDPKVLGIISSGIQYTTVIKEAIKSARERQKVLNESNYAKAQELDKIIFEQKNKASELKNKVIKFLEDEGFITK